MRRTLILMALTALVVPSCSSGGDDATDGTGTPSTDDTSSEPADDSPDDDGAVTTDDDQEPAADDSVAAGPITIWVPSSLALDTFVEAAFDEAPFGVTVTEQPATYDETPDAARAALDQGQLALVPATIGATLVDDEGAVLIGRVFEDDDPDLASSQLGVWLIASADATGVTIDAANVGSAGEPIESDGLFMSTAFRPTRRADPPVASQVGGFIKDEAQAYSDSVTQSNQFNGAAAAVETAAAQYSSRVGGSVAARTVAKAAGPVAVVLDFLKTMHDFTEAAMETIEADSNARIALYDTGMAATGMVSDATTKLLELKAAVTAGEVSAEEAQELVSTLQNAISRASNVAVDSASDLEEAGDDSNAAQIMQLRERQLDRFFDAAARTIDEIDANPDDPPVVIGPGPDRIIHVAGPSGAELLGQAAELIFGTPKGNDSKHSNGQFVVMSEGETDLTGVGQFLWAPGDGGPGLLDLLPCGQSGDAHTLCGGRDYEGDYTLVLAQLDGMIDFNSDRIYQYAFVFDRDSDPGDNYIAGGAYPDDTWDQSDIRYELWVDNGNYGLSVTEGPNFNSVDSGAVLHIEGDIIMGVIPRDEIGGGPTDPLVPMRATTFWHLGDYGQGPDRAFNIDLFPVVRDPFWVPDDVVQLSGPPGGFGGPPPIDPGRLDMFEQYRQGVASGFAGFTPIAVTPEDPAALAETDECFANAYFHENSTALVTEREQYEYDGTSIQIRYEGHGSEGEARGAFGFSSSPVSVDCRGALIESVDIGVTGVDRAVNAEMLTVDRYELGDGGDGLFLNVYSTYHDSMFVRISATGPANPELDAMIVDALMP